MRNTRFLAGLLSASICIGACNPVIAEINHDKKISVENIADIRAEQSINEKIFDTESFEKNNSVSVNSGYAKSGNLQYDDISDKLELKEKSIVLELGQVRKIDFSEPSSRISWISAKPEKVQVDANGYIMAIGKGSTKVYAWYNGKKYTIKVKVKGKNEIGSLSQLEYLAQVGKKIRSPKLNKVKVKYLRFSSDRPEVLSVENDGKSLKAKSSGIANVSYKYEFKDKKGAHSGEGTVRYSVIDPHAIDSDISISEGETRKIRIEGLHGNFGTWKSSNKKIAAVDELGVVTGLAAGKTKITCSVGGKKIKLSVNVQGTADFHDHKGENDNFYELDQNRFIKLHFYSCGRYRIENINAYKNIDIRERYTNEEEHDNITPSGNKTPYKESSNSDNKVPSENKTGSDKDNSSNTTSPSGNSSDKKRIDEDKEYESGSFKYKYMKNGDGEYGIEIVGLTVKGKKERVLVVPDKINGYPVKSIVSNALDGNAAVDILIENEDQCVNNVSGMIKVGNGVYKVLHKYTVVHELEKVDGSYEILKTEEKMAATGEVVMPNPLQFKGFETPGIKYIEIKPDDSGKVIYRYDRKFYTVSLNKGRGIKAVSGNGKYKYGQKIVISAEASNGYTFNGWTGDFGIIDKEKLETILTIPSENIVMTANAAPVIYTINMELNDEKNTVLKKNYTTESGNIILDEPQRQGYDFSGWTGDCGSVPIKKVIISKGSYGEKRFIANWNARNDTSYRVYHEREMLEEGKYETSIEELKGTTDSFVSPAVKNYEGFIKPETQKIKIRADGKASVTYRYERKKYSLKMIFEKGFAEKNSEKQCKYEEKILMSGKLKTGYSNYTARDESNNAVKFPFSMPAKNKEIHISALPTKYTITYDLNGGSQNPSNPSSYTVESESFVIKSPNRNGYTFAGWTGSGVIKPEQNIEFKKGSSTGNKSYRANWTPKTYKFTFDSKGGTAVMSKQLPFGAKFGDLPIPSRPEYIFLGWYGEGHVKLDKNSAVPAKDQTYTAEWRAITYDVILNADGGKFSNGSESMKMSGQYNISYDMPIPTKRGYKFIRWEGNGVGKVEGKKYRFERKTGSLKAVWGDYHAAANDFEVGKTYFQNEANMKKWNISGFTCIRNDYVLDGQKGFLFMAEGIDKICPISVAKFKKNNDWHYRGMTRYWDYNETLNGEFYNDLSNDLKSKIHSGIYEKGSINSEYASKLYKVKENISIISKYELDALSKQIEKRKEKKRREGNNLPYELKPKTRKELANWIENGDKVILRAIWSNEYELNQVNKEYINLREGCYPKRYDSEFWEMNRKVVDPLLSGHVGCIPIFFIAKS